ncbi:gluconeogenesis factor YvcK family protein [Kytococcus sp. Marseille-QA3725]
MVELTTGRRPALTGSLQLPPRVVALGGGHGLYATLTALRHLTRDLTAVVTVADNGGSSGRLRDDYDSIPPGDIRMALAALCDDTEKGQAWRELLQHRFPRSRRHDGVDPATLSLAGELEGHAMGNLLILTAWNRLGGPVEGLAALARLVGARGRVLPMCPQPLGIEATVLGADPDQPTRRDVVVGQKEVARSPGYVEQVRLTPRDAQAEPEAVREVAAADYVVLGPGSWYTSVMPHLLVPDLRDAVVQTSARRVLTMNIDSTGENQGRSPAEQVAAVLENAPGFVPNVVLVDQHQVADPRDLAALESIVRESDGDLHVTDLVSRTRPGVHDVMRLATAYQDVLNLG